MIRLEEIIKFIQDQVIQIQGPYKGIEIEGIAGLRNSDSRYIDWIHQNTKQPQEKAENSISKVIIANPGVNYSEKMKLNGKVLIQVKNPYLIIAKIGNEFFVRKEKPIIHPTAIIDQGAKIGKDVYIGAYSVIDACVIGDNSIIQENVIIRDCVKIGNNVLIKSGAIIGNPGFGFVKDEDGKLFKFPQIGEVIIENYVEIGSNTCIDRGAFSDTIIGSGSKINNLCHIAHNVGIGNQVIITALVNVSGSTIIGSNVWIGPNSTLKGHQIIGDNVLIGAGAVVLGDIPSNEVWVGNPARFLRKNE
ncbi:MAG: UDP-3-O-(3-hydroxymyristoyl)glucosamine N-acyltransferase [Actinomycetota bacterium]|nr:UDP-3-O-(3-hydroxymyristoyl)glucosamine N-acyltransferase [Actinomycetota bacterium]